MAEAVRTVVILRHVLLRSKARITFFRLELLDMVNYYRYFGRAVVVPLRDGRTWRTAAFFTPKL
jgi:hypothetical protein